MYDYEDLIETLEASVKKHGERPLTNKWLLNLLKATNRRVQGDYRCMDASTADIY